MVQGCGKQDRIGFGIECPGVLDEDILISFRRKEELNGEMIMVACSKVAQSKQDFSLAKAKVRVRATIIPPPITTSTITTKKPPKKKQCYGLRRKQK